MQRSAAPSIDELLARANALLPRLRERAAATELARRMPRETIDELREAGFHRVYLPRRLGGFECEWGAHYEIGRVLGEACGSSAWTASLVFSHVMFVARFPRAAQDEIFAREPQPIVATGSAGGGRLIRAGVKAAAPPAAAAAAGQTRDAQRGIASDAPWIFNGRWGFVSGVHHAHCAMVTARAAESGPPTHFVLLLPGEYEIEDTWHAEGLRGTGSHHIRVTEREIPAHRVIGLFDLVGRDPPGAAIHDGWLYRARMAPLQKSWFAGTLVGTARGALREFIATTKTRRGQILGETVATQLPVQIEIGESLAEIDAAELIAREICTRLCDAGRSGRDFVGEDLLWLRRSAALVARLATSAAGRLANGMGAGGLVGNHPVQRLFRDCRMAGSHVELNWHHCMGPSGQHALGLPTGDPLLDSGLEAQPAATGASSAAADGAAGRESLRLGGEL